MKKLIGLVFSLAILLVPLGSFAEAYVNVKGYYRSDGTYVRPHVRSNPNGLKYDNYSWTPSQGLYNATYGTRGVEWDTPTYITDPNYYTGKALYEAGQSGGTSINSNSYYNNKTSNLTTTKSCSWGWYTAPDNTCKQIIIPANAYVTGTKVNSWSCNWGYYLGSDGISCNKIIVPANAYVSGTTAGGWSCNWGYYLNDDRTSCNRIIIPENAYVSGATAGSWSCNWGYYLGDDRKSCHPIIIPQNAYVTGNTAGSWACNWGYILGSDRRSCIKN